ncbi:MAG: hypothetical protein M3083_16510 [Actinomycetota bacterium]|nr:hypothetical protein [Actinomycetota bacterium]
MHALEQGHHISGLDGRLSIVETSTGQLVKDLGEHSTLNRFGAAPPAPAAEGQGPTPALPDIGWIEFSQWANNTGKPIVYFSTKWIVPPAPVSTDQQIVFLFNGLQQTSVGPYILQPVLQWGPSAAGGGNTWAITNWYVNGQGGTAIYKTLVEVNEGDVLQGVMTLTGQSPSGFSYESAFVGYPACTLTVSNIAQLAWACETLECYGATPSLPVPQCSDYPDVDLTSFYEIDLKVGTSVSAGTDATLDWQAVTNYSDCGQKCVIASNASPGGEVRIYYRASHRPYVFMEADDGHLWTNWWDGTAWHWSDQGAPSSPFGNTYLTTASYQGRPFVFLTTSDGHLWTNWWDGAAWHWSDQGAPPPGGFSVSYSLASVTYQGRPFVFMMGADEHLWTNWWDGAAWQWSDQGVPGSPIEGGTIATVSFQGRPYAFMVGSDGHLWTNWWDGAAWHWSDQGTPSGGGGIVSAVTTASYQGRPYAFVIAKDGHLWTNWWDGKAWHWSDQGGEGNGIPSGELASVSYQGRPFVFLVQTDGHLWTNWWDGKAWHWSDQGTPTGHPVKAGSSLVTVTYDNRPFVFVTADDGHLWTNWWDGKAWQWSDQGTPGGHAIKGGLATATYSG